MLVLETVENCSVNLVHRSLELMLPMAQDIAIGDNVVVISCIMALSCIFHTTYSSCGVEDEVTGELIPDSLELETYGEGQGVEPSTYPIIPLLSSRSCI